MSSAQLLKASNLNNKPNKGFPNNANNPNISILDVLSFFEDERSKWHSKREKCVHVRRRPLWVEMKDQKRPLASHSSASLARIRARHRSRPPKSGKSMKPISSRQAYVLAKEKTVIRKKEQQEYVQSEYEWFSFLGEVDDE